MGEIACAGLVITYYWKEICDSVKFWWSWRISKMIPITKQMRAEHFWYEFKRRYM